MLSFNAWLVGIWEGKAAGDYYKKHRVCQIATPRISNVRGKHPVAHRCANLVTRSRWHFDAPGCACVCMAHFFFRGGGA